MRKLAIGVGVWAVAAATAAGLAACGGSDTGTGGAGGGATNTGPTTTTTGTAAGACTPGETQPCYSGPQGTENVGACKAGTKTCAPDGSAFGACTGEVLPKTEDCDAAKTDEDCDGKVNEDGPSCVCGDGFLSTGEQCDDGNKTPDDGCDASCHVEAVTQIALGFQYACALFYDGRVKCWGVNASGQLGIGSTATIGDGPGEMGANLVAVNLGTGHTAKSIAAGTSHACAILDDDSLKCWGLNQNGQLGQNDGNNRGDQPGEMGDALPPIFLGTGRTAVAVTAGGQHTCALLDDATAKCWGENFAGILGKGNLTGVGKAPGDMQTLQPISLGTGKTVKEISTGFSHTCVVLSDDTVKCWGFNGTGGLGIGDTTNRGGGNNQMGDFLPTVPLGTGRTAKHIQVGLDISCAHLDDDSVKCWGNGSYGALGQGNTQNLGDMMGELGDALPAIDLGTGKKLMELGARGSTPCARFDDGTFKCWGRNFAGAVGLGDTNDRGDTAGEMGNALPAIDLGVGVSPSFIATGPAFTCAGLASGRIKCWGANDAGQLGLGDTQNRGDAAGEMGDALASPNLLSDTW
jgi:cysteine-rich repeat protein